MVHSHVIKLGYFMALSMQNQVLYAYAKCGEFRDVHQLFDEMPERNIVSWNTVICGMVSRVELGFCYFRRMLMEMVSPDSTTMNALLRSCGGFSDVDLGRQLHCFAMKMGLSVDRFVGTAIVDLYGNFGIIGDAKSAFDEVELRDLISWNVMVSMYVHNNLIQKAFGLFRTMQVEGVRGDEFTCTSLLNSCSSNECGELGKQLHGLVIKLSFDFDIQVASVLIDMYAKNGSICDARTVFDAMNARNRVTWNTMIVGYGQLGHGRKSMELFVEMRRNVDTDRVTVASVLSSCGNLAAISETAQIHAYVVKTKFDAYLSVANALIITYSNCGSLSSASKCFNSVTKPDLITWTSILRAHAYHGHVEGSIKIFEMMLMSGQKPDKIAFLGILSACCHGGLIHEGHHYFKLMTTEYGMIPSSEHSACIIDLLGRSGLVNEASSIMSSGFIGFESNTLGALIGASKAHGHVKLVEWAAGKLFELEPDNPVNYTLMSNMYASVGQWNDAARVRKLMTQKFHAKVPGCSWIEVSGKVHTFLSSDTSHSSLQEVYSMLGRLIRPMKDDDFVEVQF
ncbi:hypothetical protein RND81_03G212600 [Saponaria officinalis]